jgi:hypothetical protein
MRKYGTSDYAFRTDSARCTACAVRPDFVRHTTCNADSMAREISIGARRFWIVSEPTDKGWTAKVLEVLDELGGTQQIEIETMGETRSVADDRAVGQLQQRIREQSLQPS